MTMNLGNWNQGVRALVVGGGAANDAVAEALVASGAQVQPVSHDGLSDDRAVAAAFDAAETALGGKLGILVFGDAPGTGVTSEKLDLGDWRQVTEVNLDARFFCCTELARRCLADGRKGAILHLLSKAADRAGPGVSPGASAAGGVLNLNMSLAVEWGRDNIRSNAIATRLVNEVSPEDTEQLATLGALAAYFCSDYGSYITGSCMGIDEG